MYKNLTVFTLDGTTDFSNLPMAVAAVKFNHATSMQMSSSGWESPVENSPLDFNFKVNDSEVIALVMRKEERIIPNSSVDELLKEGIIEFEKMNHIKPSKKQRAKMKENVIISLMPRALLKTTRVQGYVDLLENRIVVNTASIGQAEEFVSLLRYTLGDLSAFPFYVDGIDENSVFTSWVRNIDKLSHAVKLGDSCKLIGEQAKAITLKNFNLVDNETVNAHIDNGMVVSELRLNYEDKIDFTLNSNLQFKSIKQVISDDANVIAETNNAEERFIVNSVLDVASHRELISYMITELLR